MTELSDLLHTMTEWRFLFAVGGVVIVCLLGWALLNAFVAWRKRGTVPVKLRVQKLLAEHQSDGQTLYRPDFVIISGAYKGRSFLSDIASNPADHVEDEIADGYYNMQTGVISSETTLGSIRFIAKTMAWAGVVASGAALYLLWRLSA